MKTCNKGIKCISIWVYFTLKRCINLFTFMPVKNGSVFSWFMTLNLPKSKMLLCVCHCAINTIIYPSGCQATGCYWLGTLEMQSGAMFFFFKYFRCMYYRETNQPHLPKTIAIKTHVCCHLSVETKA